MHHAKADILRLYLPRSIAGRGLIQLELSYKTSTISLFRYLNLSDDRLLGLALKHEKEKGWHYVVKNARELVQEIDLDLETEFSFQFKYGYIFPFLFFYFLIFFFRLLYPACRHITSHIPFQNFSILSLGDLFFVITCFSLFLYRIFCHPSEDLIFPIEFCYIYQIVFHSVLLLSIFALVPFWYLEYHWYLWSNTSS